MISQLISKLKQFGQKPKPKPTNIPVNLPAVDDESKEPEENPIKVFIQNFAKELVFAVVEIFFWGFLISAGLYFYIGPLFKINFPFGFLEIFGCGAIVYALYDLLPSIINRCRFR